MFQRERASAVDMRHQRHQVLSDGKASSALGLRVALQIHFAVRTLYRLAFFLNIFKWMMKIKDFTINSYEILQLQLENIKKKKAGELLVGLAPRLGFSLKAVPGCSRPQTYDTAYELPIPD